MSNIVFIGGTGRSGTNILLKILKKHSQVAGLFFEKRFILDPDGIIDFYHSYQNWSPYLANVKIKRLEKLFLDLSRTGSENYADWELSKHIPNYEEYVKELILELKEFSYKADWWASNNSELYYGRPKSKQELAEIFAAFLRKIADKDKVYIEDATWSILFADPLSQILPEAKFINIYRDPRDVVASLIKQRWAPKDPKQAAVYYKDIINQWFLNRSKLDQKSFYEFKLEDLVNNPEDIIKKVCQFLNIDYEPEMIDLDLSKANVGCFKEEFSENEKEEINEILEDIIIKLGYNG